MGNVRLYGSTSGYTELAPPAVAPDGVLALPSGTGTLATAAYVDAAVAAGGKVLQVVRATDSTNRSTTSTSFVDVTGMSVTITPTSATSNIMLLAFVYADTASTTDGNNYGIYQITTSGNVAISGAENVGIGLVKFLRSATGYTLNSPSLCGFHSPASTSAQTYKLRFKTGSGGTTISTSNNTNTGQIFAIEVSP